MGITANRLLIVIAVCSVAGVIVGGTASRAEIQNCFSEETLTDECLTQNPVAETVEGMGMGLVAGAGAAVGASWHLWKKDNQK